MSDSIKNKKYDVIVIGGGPAGIEAAYAAAKMGADTLLLTLDEKKIGVLPCNPSIGGLGKGHIVFEIAALGGLMPKLCNTTYLQARMLNTKKGPAVQGLRLQIDKYAYKDAAQRVLRETPNLTVLSGEATQLLFIEQLGKKTIIGVMLATGENFYAQSVVVTTGTFLNGLIHIGEYQTKAGRINEGAVTELSGSIQQVLGCILGRFKTGTPPRLLRDSINIAVMEKQEPCNALFLFDFDSVAVQEKIPCYITHTNEKTHEIIKTNLFRSALYSGTIKGIGPRYCPSIEDKIGRYPDKNSHHIFVEPEGGENLEVYPAGLSTSLPFDVQEVYIRSIVGFEKAIICCPGYAIEYDFIQPTHLSHSLEAKEVKGLFFAGQINGTTGYEEAAGQGIIAGINAALYGSGKEPFILRRHESYIGVMIDDLVTLGVDEPYRMFTSRAERRLLLRQDNAFLRLMPYGHTLGLIDDATYARFLFERDLLVEATKLLAQGSELYRMFDVPEFEGEVKERAQLALMSTLTERGFSFEDEKFEEISWERVVLGVHAEAKYGGYLKKEQYAVEQMKKYEVLQIPAHIEYSSFEGLRKELIEKLSRYKPKTIAQAQLIQGMTPAAISLLIYHIRKHV